jgi:hypothetical protein
MKEEFLHYLWRTRRFDTNNLKTTSGEPLTILQFGEYNTHAGPDFLNAQIRINDMTWAGSVEMHVKASDWLLHKHESDDAYRNVILHVVYEDDMPIKRSNNSEFSEDTEGYACLSLQHRFAAEVYQQYWEWVHTEHWIPCYASFFKVDEFTKTMWYERLLVERLEQKTEAIATSLANNKGDWEETFYQHITRNFGLKVNTEPMEQLARTIPHRLLAKYKNNLFQIEALLFGQSGLLEKPLKDEYPNILKKEYAFMQLKHNLMPINAVTWKFMRMRPANFPTIRIAQLAALIFKSSHLFSKVLDCEHITDIEKLLDVKIGDYWQTHYVFDILEKEGEDPSVSEGSKGQKSLGKEAKSLLIINTIVPFLFYYGAYKKEEIYKDRALQFLENLQPEKNSIIEKWSDMGVKVQSAYNTQALLQLKNEYCTKKRCLECAIGNVLLK